MADRNAPLVSVIVPLYNNAEYVGEALKSAVEQDHPNLEVLVVDDGSTDGSGDVAAAFGSPVIVMRQDNQGAAAARNRAFEAARGEFIAFLDSDDLWMPGKVSTQVRYLQANPDIGMVYSSWRVWQPDSRGKFILPRIPAGSDAGPELDVDHSGWLYNELLKDCVVHTTTAMIRKSVIDEIGPFDVTLRRGQDYDYWLRVSRVTRINKLRTVLSLYRIHERGQTQQPQPINYGATAIQKALDRWGRIGPDGSETPRGEMRRVLARHWFGFGYMHLHRGDPEIAQDAFKRCVRFRPLWYPGWLNLWRARRKSRFTT